LTVRYCLPLDLTLGDRVPIGGKARSLVRLVEAGWPVPPAFVVSGALCRSLCAGAPPIPASLADAAALDTLDQVRGTLLTAPFPDGFLDELDQRLDQLTATSGDPEDGAGARFSVRSSFATEDQPRALGAGIYESRTNVDRGGVTGAIRAVLASAFSPAAVTYARRHRLDVETSIAAVLVHEFIPGDAWGSAAWDPAGATPFRLEPRTGVPAAGAGLAGDAGGPTLSTRTREIIEAALRDLAGRYGAVEIEWVSQGDRVTFLQLRNYVAPRAPRPWAGAAALAGGDWRWDAAHNPLPLSPAQAGLVTLVDGSCRTGFRQRVVSGYLFVAPGGAPPPRVIAGAQVASAFAELRTTTERDLATLKATSTLEAALGLFVTAYEPLFGELQPAAARAREDLSGFLRTHLAAALPKVPLLLSGVPSTAEERRRAAQRLAQAGDETTRAEALAAYLARFGDEAPVWDVAIPTYREDPALLLTHGSEARSGGAQKRRNDQRHDHDQDQDQSLAHQEAAQEVMTDLPRRLRPAFKEVLAAARAAVAVGEDDDHLFARLQAAVRRAMLQEGGRLVKAGVLGRPADVFWLALDLLRAAARGAASLAASQATDLVTRARRAHEAALRDPPPAPSRSSSPSSAGPGELDHGPERVIIRGQGGSGGRAIGRAFHYPGPLPTGPAAAEGVLVATTLLPTELPLLNAAALVVETGGPLDHVAAQARERGIPAVVGAGGARAAIPAGALVLVDGDSASVIRLDGG
jgi:pyruvate,water dikinase